MSTQPLIPAVEKGLVRRSLFFLSFSGVLALQIPAAARAGTVVKLIHSETSAAAFSLSSRDGMPAGWKYLPAVDLYIVDEEGEVALNRWRREGLVEAAEESFDVHLEAVPSVPNDPFLSAQGWVDDKNIDVGALKAWEAAWEALDQGGRTTVAVIDTGIDTRHPDLAPNLWINGGEVPDNGRDDDGNGFVDDVNGYNFWDDSGDVTDPHNHGSHMAGIIGAVGDNGIGVAGVDWNARLMTLRFTDARGNGTSTKAIEAIDYAIRNGAKIINASWTLKLDDDPGVLLLHAIQKAESAGLLFITAAGNQFRTDKGLDVDRSPVYPAAFRTDTMIAVAAVDAEGSLASYSNFGKSTVHLAAPGASIVSTSADGDYLTMSGTSMAAAFMSGAAALVHSVDPTLTAAQIKAVLESAVTPSASLKDKVSTGGLVNLFEAVSIVRSGSLPEPQIASVSPASPAPEEETFAAPFGGCNLVVE